MAPANFLPEKTMPASAELKRNLFCISFLADYEQIFWTLASSAQFDIHAVQLKKEARKKLLYRFTPAFKRQFLYDQILRELFDRDAQALFVIDEREEVLHYVVENRPQRDIAVVVRNPIATKKAALHLLQQVKALGYPIFSFDPQDCRDHGFGFYRQYAARLPDVSLPDEEADFCFFGRDKGRREQVEELARQLQGKGFKTAATFVRTDRPKGFFKRKLNRKKPNIPYRDYLAASLSARCIIDILQPGQSGLTLRPLEAMLYQRKLLTNNRVVASEPLYHPDNIFILKDGDSLEGIEDFMKRPFRDPGQDVTGLYSVDALIRQITDAEGIKSPPVPAA
ncbi:hypothetical protein [Allorhizobium undicola]|uniref:hypothetical protein n=1 Tax=Allorhizobium undicola TaxID=78527 RepID=UPI0004839A4D|nr:hypothetical protein [Allorhizobium undicola]